MCQAIHLSSVWFSHVNRQESTFEGLVFNFLKKTTILKYHIKKLCLKISVLFFRNSNVIFLTTFIIYFNVHSWVDLWFTAPKLILWDYKVCNTVRGAALHICLALVKALLIYLWAEALCVVAEWNSYAWTKNLLKPQLLRTSDALQYSHALWEIVTVYHQGQRSLSF